MDKGKVGKSMNEASIGWYSLASDYGFCYLHLGGCRDGYRVCIYHHHYETSADARSALH